MASAIRRRPAGWPALALLALLLPALPAGAETTLASKACQQSCAATSAVPRENRPPVQACLIRCTAAEGFARAPAATPRPAALAQSRSPGVSWGAAYVGPVPDTSLGLAVGVADRAAANSRAQSSCEARGARCRLALDFTERCGAVAQARQTLGLVRTADRGTYSVSFAAAGAGATREAAEIAAQGACQARTRTGTCDIAASACATP